MSGPLETIRESQQEWVISKETKDTNITQSDDYEMLNSILSDIEKLNQIPCQILDLEEEPYSICYFKVIIIGNSAVGKTQMKNRIMNDMYNEEEVATIGVEYESLIFKIEESMIKVMIWDTAGQEAFQSITKIFFRQSNLIFLAYSITNRDSFNNLPYWLSSVKNDCDEDAIIILVGTQMDEQINRQVSYEEGLKFKEQHKLNHFMETSSKTGVNIKESFLLAARMLYIRNLGKIKRNEEKSEFRKLVNLGKTNKDEELKACTCANC